MDAKQVMHTLLEVAPLFCMQLPFFLPKCKYEIVLKKTLSPICLCSQIYVDPNPDCQ